MLKTFLAKAIPVALVVGLIVAAGAGLYMLTFPKAHMQGDATSMTQIEAGVSVNDGVESAKAISADANAPATREIYGVLQNQVNTANGATWTIDGHEVAVNPQTALPAGLTVGSLVAVQATVTADGSLVANEINVLGDGD